MFHQSVEEVISKGESNLNEIILQNGYYSFDDFASFQLVNSLLEEIQSLQDNFTSSSCYGVYHDTQGRVLVMNKLDRESDFLFDFSRNPIMLNIAKAFLGKPAIPLHVEYFSKPTDGISYTPPHQDHIFYQDHFDDELAISFWIALDDVSANSGALEYSLTPTISLLPHKPSDTIDFGCELESKNISGLSFATVVIPRGGCIVHHSYSIHRTQPNRSGKPRRAVVFNYRGSPYLEHIQAKNL